VGVKSFSVPKSVVDIKVAEQIVCGLPRVVTY
jgi:hypothetical protein